MNKRKSYFIIFLIVILFLLFSCNSENNSENIYDVNDFLNDLGDKNLIESSLNVEEEMIQTNQTGIDTNNENIFELDDFSNDLLNHYFINASLNVEKGMIQANQTVIYTNNENIELEELYFHLYPNAYSDDNYPVLLGKDRAKLPKGGSIDILSVIIDGEESEIEIVDTILKIKFDKNFKINEKYKIDFVYNVNIPLTKGRFGLSNGYYDLGNWYPILAVYDEDGWNLDPFYPIGDPFYSDISNYDVIFTVPENFMIASSGYIYKLDDNKTYSFRGDNIRDYALVISDKFKRISKKLNDIEVYLYYPIVVDGEDIVDKLLDYSVEALKLYNDTIGRYPYKTFSVVSTEFSSGMEYPSLVMISNEYCYSNNYEKARATIAHETAHQWFYAMIGNDEFDDGWIDEGLTSFMAAYYHLKYVGESKFEEIIDKTKSRTVDANGKYSIDMMKSIKDFSGWSDYGPAAYGKPTIMYSKLFADYGEEKYIEFVSTIYNNYKYKIIKKEDIIYVLKLVYGENIETFIEEWLN